MTEQKPKAPVFKEPYADVNPVAYPTVTNMNPSAYPTAGNMNPVAYPTVTNMNPSAYPTTGNVNPVAHPTVTNMNPSAYPTVTNVNQRTYPTAASRKTTPLSLNPGSTSRLQPGQEGPTHEETIAHMYKLDECAAIAETFFDEEKKEELSLAKGMIWSQILGPPRCRQPFLQPRGSRI
ncbi:MAG: hypothetical protein FWH55_10130 [Oscillospiraceae bacterium]|nr:hypothetical protein [Oscillospiraceae bacterium]